MDTRQQRNPTVSPDEWCASPADVRPYEIAPTAYIRGDDCDRRLRGSGIEGKYVVLNM